MKTANHTFASPRAKERLARLVNYVKTHKVATIKNFQHITGLSATQTGYYVRHLIEKGELHCAIEAVMSGGGWEPAVFAAGPKEPVTLNDEPTIVVNKKWPPNHVRDSLHCYLFGVPDVLKTNA